MLVFSELVLHVYQYCPPEGADPEALEQAKEDGCVVVQNSDITYGRQTWLDFLEAAEEGKEAFIQIATYYELGSPERMSEELYETSKEDYPKLFIRSLTYDGSKEFERSYQYLMCYTGEDYEGPYISR